ncbi:MAG TPA: mechanosensitive ion channel family protein [Wenzhouxiangella sp.]|nr:mechanosensitive ion channel family protein [Wenzhouxiangella sp.]
MEQPFEKLGNLAGLPVWLIEVFAIILAALLLELAFRFLINYLDRAALKSEHLWDDAFVHAGKRPFSLLIWWQGTVMAARVFSPRSDVFVFDAGFLNIAQQLGLVVAATWFFFRLTNGFERAFVDSRRRKNEHVDVTTVTALARIVRIAFIITGTLTALSVLDIPISGLLAAGGVGGIAVGMAAQDLLANFFGGFTVFMDRPFSVGDWVRSPDREIEGIVEKIDWRITTIRKFDKRPMYVPNAMFTTMTLENPSRMSHRQISATIGVSLDDFDAIDRIVGDIREYITGHEAIDTTQSTLINFDGYGESSLDIMIYCFTKTTIWATWLQQREEILLEAGRIIRSHGARIARPARSMTVDLAEEAAAELRRSILDGQTKTDGSDRLG